MSYSYYPKLTVGMMVVSTFVTLIPLFQAKILGDIIDQISTQIISSTSTAALVQLILIYAGIWATIRFLGVLELYFGKLWRDGAMHAFELTILKKRTEIDLGHYENPEFQNLLTRAFNQGFAGPMVEIVMNQVVIVASVITIIVTSFITSTIGWNIYFIVIASSIPSFVVQAKYGHKVWGIWAEHSERQKRYISMRSKILGRTGITQTKLLQNGERILSIIKTL
jgi:ATP-binding cassette subfamily B protein